MAAAALVVPILLTGVSSAQTVPAEIPAGTEITFHVTTPLSSNQSKTGAHFQFVLLAPIVAGGTIVASAGAVGDGTLILAGPAGNKGHEGDLTLRIDSVASANGGRILFDDQHFEMNGTNEKAASTLAGFIPFVGFFAQFMRGQDERITVSTPIHTTLLRPARIVAPPPFCAPPTSPPTQMPSALPSPSASTAALPTPTASPTPTAPPTPSASQAPCVPLPPCPPVTPSPTPLLTPVPVAASPLPSPLTASPAATPTPTPSPCLSPTPYPWVTPYPSSQTSAPGVPKPTASPSERLTHG